MSGFGWTNEFGLNNNGMRDEARDEESELGLNNNGMRDKASNEERDEAREEEKSF